MAIKYYKLIDLLNKRNISKTELANMAGFSPKTMSQISGNKIVSVDTLDKVCKVLNVQPSDIMEYIPDEKDNG